LQRFSATLPNTKTKIFALLPSVKPPPPRTLIIFFFFCAPPFSPFQMLHSPVAFLYSKSPFPPCPLPLKTSYLCLTLPQRRQLQPPCFFIKARISVFSYPVLAPLRSCFFLFRVNPLFPPAHFMETRSHIFRATVSLRFLGFFFLRDRSCPWSFPAREPFFSVTRPLTPPPSLSRRRLSSLLKAPPQTWP